jgi:hypothetical protein
MKTEAKIGKRDRGVEREGFEAFKREAFSLFYPLF